MPARVASAQPNINVTVAAPSRCSPRSGAVPARSLHSADRHNVQITKR